MLLDERPRTKVHGASSRSGVAVELSPATVTNGLMLKPGAGRPIRGGGLDATLKVSGSQGAFASSFEVRVPPGYDVGAHVHHEGEEIFFVLEGELDVLAFEPLDRTVSDWHAWKSQADGQTYLRGGPGSMLYVSRGTPHAFANTTNEDVRMFFQATTHGGHENYFQDLADLLTSSHGRPSAAAMTSIEEKYHFERLTPLADGS